MLNTSMYIDNWGKFYISEGSFVYKIPFNIIHSLGRKLFFYSDRNSSTPVQDWYNKLNEYNKEEIQVVKTEEIKYQQEILS
jgi:hypothetical protein